MREGEGEGGRDLRGGSCEGVGRWVCGRYVPLA